MVQRHMPMNAEERELFNIRGKLAMRYCAPIGFAPEDQWDSLRSATVTLLRINGRQFGVTNDHVVKAAEEMRGKYGSLYCQVGAAKVDLLNLLIDRSEHQDIAVLDLQGVEESQIRAMTSKIPLSFYEPYRWPPPTVESGQLLMIGGFPGVMRVQEGVNEFLFRSLSSSGVRVENVHDDRIGCRLELELCSLESDVPGEPFPDLAGMSGGPVMVQRLSPGGVEIFEAVGIIQEYSADWDMVYVTPLSAISDAGQVIVSTGEMARSWAMPRA